MFSFFWAGEAGDGANQIRSAHEAHHERQSLFMSNAIKFWFRAAFESKLFPLLLLMPPLLYTIEELNPSGFYGRDFSALLADETYFVLDPLQDSQLQLWPPERIDAELPVFLYYILAAEMERRGLPVPKQPCPDMQ